MITRTVPPQSSLTHCLSLMEPDTHRAIRANLDRWEAHGLCVFHCVDLTSSLVGHRFAIPYGPNNTLTQAPTDTVCRVSPPEGRAWQYQLVAWC
jgi:hypothetical protein